MEPTLRELYAAVREGMPSAFEAEQLFAHVTGLRVHDLVHVDGQAASRSWARRLQELMQRRAQGEPLQYLLEEWEFYGLPFSVGEGVLIPRADTECLVDAALEAVKQSGCGSPRVLDLCSGSGAVAVALAHEVPQAQVSALELDGTAFGYLMRNIERNGVQIEAVRGDVLTYSPPGPLHVITANPPYIPSGELDGLQREVQFEPRTALDGGGDGLRFYRAIAARYRPFLREGGSLCLEVGFDQADAVAEVLCENGWNSIARRRDLAGNNRVVCAVR